MSCFSCGGPEEQNANWKNKSQQETLDFLNKNKQNKKQQFSSSFQCKNKTKSLFREK